MNKTFANPGRLKPWLDWVITREFENSELNSNSKCEFVKHKEFGKAGANKEDESGKGHGCKIGSWLYNCFWTNIY